MNDIWVGVVENIDDPLRLGRMRVRIINYHTENLTQLPSEDLPWAISTFSPDGSRNLTAKLDDWVIGYFADGVENAQVPIIIGILPGIKEIETSTSIGFSRQLTVEQKNNLPAPASQIAVDRLGEPIIARIARGDIEGTPQAISNNNREHVCDISNEMSRAASWVRLKFTEFMKIIREAIRAILKTLGLSPDGASSRFAEIAKNIAEESKRIQKFLKDINDAVEVFNNFIKKVNEMIKYILSLPAKILALLKDCLNNLYKALAKGFADLFTDSTGDSGDSAAFSELANEIKSTFSAAIETTGKIAEAAASAAATTATIGVAAGTVTKTLKI